MGITRTASVPAIPVGRARSAASAMTSVKWPTVQDEAGALKASVNALKDTLEISAKKVRMHFGHF